MTNPIAFKLRRSTSVAARAAETAGRVQIPDLFVESVYIDTSHSLAPVVWLWLGLEDEEGWS